LSAEAAAMANSSAVAVELCRGLLNRPHNTPTNTMQIFMRGAFPGYHIDNHWTVS
jgi:hypothetical protein